VRAGRTLTLLSLLLMPAAPLIAGERVPLYPGPAPGTEDWVHAEQTYFSSIFDTEVVTNVAAPSLEVFLPEGGAATRTGVIIAPGGGFHALSINSEGNDVAAWLNARGVAAFVLRYRLVPGGDDAVAELVAKPPEQSRADMARIAPLAGADGLRAMRVVRERAEQFGVDPERLGFMGFSAGGAVTLMVGFDYDSDTRPAFLAPIYASTRMLGNPTVPADAPPLFLVAASDDQLGLAPDSVALYRQWLDAGKPVEMHLYAAGGHGFGMRRQHLPSDTWIERFGDWLDALGYL
jgi:acetyl esterase/lipase